MTLKEMVPWRWGNLRRWDDENRPFETFFRDMDGLHKEMDRLFNDFWKDAGRPGLMTHGFTRGEIMPQVDETEDDKAFHVRVELPGMGKDDVDITLNDGRLTIRGEKKREEEDKGKDFYRSERSFGVFRRVLPIPGDVDEKRIEASFEKGVLNILLPKTDEAVKKVKHIPVKAA